MLSKPFDSETIDWQSVADMIVTRYTARLKYLALPEISKDDNKLLAGLSGILLHYIDYDNRSRVDEIARCSTAYMPPTKNMSLAAETITYVQNYICHGLFLSLYSCAFPQNPRADCVDGITAPQLIDNLITKLEWTTWKECGPCAYDEICFIPIWPFGSLSDWERPKCTNGSALENRRGYWGRGPGPRRPPPKGHEMDLMLLKDLDS
jgi:hypothetical protein